MSLINREALEDIEGAYRNMYDGRWDEDFQTFVAMQDGTMGMLAIPQMARQRWPRPADILKVITEINKRELVQLKENGHSYYERHPEQEGHGKVIGIVTVVEAWGMTEDEYNAAVETLPLDVVASYVQEQGFVPMEKLGGREERIVLCVDRDSLQISMLIRYRDTNDLEYLSEEDSVDSRAGGDLAEALVSLLGTFVAVEEYEQQRTANDAG